MTIKIAPMFIPGSHLIPIGSDTPKLASAIILDHVPVIRGNQRTPGTASLHQCLGIAPGILYCCHSPTVMPIDLSTKGAEIL